MTERQTIIAGGVKRTVIARIAAAAVAGLLLSPPPALAQTAAAAGQLKGSVASQTKELHGVAEKLPGARQAAAVADATALQAALDAGGVVELQPAGAFTSATRFTVTKPGTIVNCRGALVVGGNGPAFHIRPGAHDTVLNDCSAGASWSGPVVQCGDNDAATQGTRDKVPQRVRLVNLKIDGHRGKRGLEVNCAATVVNPTIVNVWSGDERPLDSQAIAILNTCGPVSVLGGTLSAGSEIVLVGGDRLQITDCPENVPADLLFDDVTMVRAPEWQTDGVKRSPKNVFELKAGKRITVRRSRLAGSWKSTQGRGDSTQDGSCIVITPKNGQYIADVLFEENTIERCGAGVQLMGKDYNSDTPIATAGVVFRGNRWTIEGRKYGGRGILALVVGGMRDATFDNETVIQTGASLFLVDSDTPTGPFTITRSRMTSGRLVCAAPGVNYCGPAPPAYAERAFTLTAEGNTFADAPRQFKGLYPKNEWVTRAELEALK